MTPADPINAIFAVARSISMETRARVREELDDLLICRPVAVWGELVERRRKNGTCATLATAGKQLVRLSVAEARPFVNRAAKNLIRAVRDLAEFTPEYGERLHVVAAEDARELRLSRYAVTYTTWTPTDASVKRLDELRDRVKVRVIELRALFEYHPDPMSRFLAVAQQAAAVVLEPTAAGLVAGWLANLEASEPAHAPAG